jgi:imidazolonepropionase-like amidohydrolase
VLALTAIAHQRKKHVMAHASGTIGIGIAIEGRVDEMEQLEQADMTSLEVINACTGGNANTLLNNPNDRHLKTGNKARFILTKNNPLGSVSKLRKEKTIVYDDQLFCSSESTMDRF